MGSISALGTTFNLPNYGGELIQLSKTSAPFLSMIGVLNGINGGPGGGTDSPQFEWQTTDLRASTPNNVVVEGADAPTRTGRTRANVSNVVERHHSAVGVSYTKQAATGAKSGINNMQANPVLNELDNQVTSELLAMKRDVNASLLVGAYHLAADNSETNKTRGIIPAITTNIVDAANGVTVSYTTATTGVFTVSASAPATGSTVVFTSITTNTEIVVDTPYYVTNVSSTTFKISATKGGSFITFAATGSGSYSLGVAVTDSLVSSLTQSIFDNGGLTENEVFTLFCNSQVKIDLSRTYIKNYGSSGYMVQSRNVGGVNVDTIITDFGQLNIALEPQMPRHKLLAVSLNECMPVFLDIPGKGHFFVEPLAKTGAKDEAQMYGEVGLKYGAESHHGVIKNLNAFQSLS